MSVFDSTSDTFDLNQYAAEEGIEELIADSEYDISMLWDEDDYLHLVIAEDDGEEVIITLEELVDELVSRGRIQGDFRNLYCVAHELDRYQEQVREAAQLMEEGIEYVADLYGMDKEDFE